MLNYTAGGNIWEVVVDVAFLCATPNELHFADAKMLVATSCKAVAESANMPTIVAVTHYLQQRAVLFAPEKAANAATSQLEMAQNSAWVKWTFAEVDVKLKSIMENIFDQTHDAAVAYHKLTDYALGVNAAGFERVVEVM